MIFQARLKELSDEKEVATSEKKTLEYELEHSENPRITDDEIANYIEDFKPDLLQGSIVERKAFIRSFIKKITG